MSVARVFTGSRVVEKSFSCGNSDVNSPKMKALTF